MAKYYPAFIDVSNRTCIVIGGSDIGRDKVEKLIDALDDLEDVQNVYSNYEIEQSL